MFFDLTRKLITPYRRHFMLWLVLSIGVGILSGLAAVAFFSAVEFFKFFFLNQLAGLDLPTPAGEHLFHGTPGPVRLWFIPVLTTGVALFTGFLVTRFIPESITRGTDGTDAMINSFHQQKGYMSPKVAFIKGVTAILTITSGGSAGREGPVSQIGAAIGSFAATRLHLSARQRRILLLAGAAGGLGAIFRAPLGGALTAIEVIYREDFEAEAILPAVLSSVVAYSLFTFFFGNETIFAIPSFSFTNMLELPFYTLLAFFCALSGWLYVGTFKYIKYTVFERITAQSNIIVSMGLGGLAMGLLGMFFPHLLSGGYGWLEMAIRGELAVSLMLGILLGKILATAVTVGSGMSGGMFAPALFVGGMSGGIVGALAHRFFPDITTQPGGYVLVGMAAFFAGVAKAPIGPMIMVCELTHGYGLLAPLMLASVVCILLGKKTSLYEHQVENKFESPAHTRDMTINLLETLLVKDSFYPARVTTLEEGTTLKAMTDIVANTNELSFPVKNCVGKITGMLEMTAIRNVLFEDSLFELVVVQDIASPAVTLLPGDTLYTALMRFVESSYTQIPVVQPDDTDTIIGLINREDVFKAYAQALERMQDQT